MEQERVNEIVKALMNDSAIRLTMQVCCKTKEERMSFLYEMLKAMY